MKNTPEIIDKLEPNEIIIVGTNLRGASGAGLARIAVEKFGLKNGIPMGLCGQSYGIITKDLNQKDLQDKNYKIDMISFIYKQVSALYDYARFRINLLFYMTKIGTGLGGFSIEEIKIIFDDLEDERPSNVILPIEFEL